MILMQHRAFSSLNKAIYTFKIFINWICFISEATTRGVLRKKVLLQISQNSQEKPVPETMAQVFSCEFYEISKNTFFTEHLWTTAFVIWS